MTGPRNIEYTETINRIRKQPSRFAPTPLHGQIWTTKTRYDLPVKDQGILHFVTEEVDDKVQRTVLVLTDSEGSLFPEIPTIQVVPFSSETDSAFAGDLIFAKGSTDIFECDVMAEFWNALMLLERNLDQFLGRIKHRDLSNDIRVMWANVVYGDEEQELKLKTIQEHLTRSVGHRANNFRQSEIEATRHLRKPADVLLSLL